MLLIQRERRDVNKKPIAYPYIPNSVPAVKDKMLKEVGAKSVEEFFSDVPRALSLSSTSPTKNRQAQKILLRQYCILPVTRYPMLQVQPWWLTVVDWQDPSANYIEVESVVPVMFLNS